MSAALSQTCPTTSAPPLTSIKGFSEAILDGTIPPELQAKYMRRIIAETERLAKLTENMLSLNSLGMGQTLHKTVFNLNGTGALHRREL